MLAQIKKDENRYLALFKRQFNYSIDEVWSYLTENEKLKMWFPELQVDELRIGGHIKFDMQDGTFEEMEILDLQLKSVLEYTWGEDIIRFQLEPNQEGCQLILIEKITYLTEHTPRDLAGWHVCLDVIAALLEGKVISPRTNEWKYWYEQYIQAIQLVQKK